jgi:hypothetical protein
VLCALLLFAVIGVAFVIHVITVAVLVVLLIVLFIITIVITVRDNVALDYLIPI